MKRKYFLVSLFLMLVMFLVGCNGNGGSTPPITLNQSPTASFNADPTSGAAPLEVFFNASSSSDSDGSIIIYTWNFKDGDTGTGETINHTFSSIGSYIVELTVIDNEGATDSVKKTINVTDPITTNHTPTITSTPDTTATINQTYAYNVDATDPDWDTLTYSLITSPAGMTINSTTGLISWTPFAAGDKDVTVQVSDGDLNDSQSFFITVSSIVLPTYTITATCYNGSINPSGNIVVTEGSNQSFTIMPDYGYQIEKVLVDGDLTSPVSTYTFNNVNEDHTITALCSLKTHVTVSGTVYYSTTPLPNVRVEIVIGDDKTNPPLFSITTDISGNYNFFDVPVGAIWLLVYGPTEEYQNAFSNTTIKDDIIDDIYLCKKMTILSPEEDAVVSTLYPTFCWQGLPEAVKYTFQLNTTSGWELIDWVKNIQSTCYTPTKMLQNGKQYTWIIEAIGINTNPVGCATFSTFTVNID